MQIRSSHVVPAVAVTSVLVLAVTMFLTRGLLDALLLTALVAVLTGLYLLRRHARARTLYHRHAEPQPTEPRGETVGTGKGAS
ncbi:hypothetical protein AB0C12_27800 [Actinoplanes sp. NPDC048967]|uniref:hypothetical protein n=1 Tax=Actinoplanes sp. NPDC048967 TaxID=3155269 RepID=UPI0033CB94C4